VPSDKSDVQTVDKITHTDSFGFEYIRCDDCGVWVRVGNNSCKICGSRVDHAE